ncbi:MAG TPA: hypothetical protein VF680_00495 [Allosphingosinicella sp.]
MLQPKAGNRSGLWLALAAGAAVLALLIAWPLVRGAYQRVAGAPEPHPVVAIRPPVLLMTALPLVWGEGGAFDPQSRPVAIYTALQREFTMKPIDALDSQSLGEAPVLLLIQPRWLAPKELVALDAWIRGGGRALILTDPTLHWPSDLPPGDIRRPPPVGLLGPLLTHWGLTLAAGPEHELDRRFERNRRLAMEAPGHFTATGRACRVTEPWFAECRVGKGQALLLADADLVRDELWLETGSGSGQGRTADNPLFLADLLDRLAGVNRQRTEQR